MKKFLIFLSTILFVLFFYSCKKDKELKQYEFCSVKKIQFPLDSTKYGLPDPVLFDYDTIDGIETLILVINNDRLAFYDISKQIEYHSVPLLKYRQLYNFDYINKDSILLFYENDYSKETQVKESEQKFFFDNENIQLSDYFGNTKICAYKFNEELFPDIKSKSEIIPFWVAATERLTSVGSDFFFPTSSYEYNTLGKDKESSKKYPVFCHYDLKTSEIKVSKSVEYPYTGNLICYDTRFPKIHSCVSANGFPLIRFFYWPEVYEWDYKNDIVKKYKLKSQIFDTIYPLPTVNSAPESLCAMFYDISYDPYNEKYYSDLLINDYFTNEIVRTTIIADKNFKYLSETIGLGLGSMPIFTEKYIIDYFYRNDSIILSYKILKKTDKPLKPYIDSVKTKINKNRIKREKVYNDFKKQYNNKLISILDYYKVRNNESDYVLLTVYEGNGCPPCKQSLKKLISQNNDIFADLPFFLILSGSQMEVENGRYETFENLKFVQDTLAIAEHLGYIEGKYNMLNPRLTIVKDNKVVLDTIYDAFHLESDLIPKLLDNLGLKEKNK